MYYPSTLEIPTQVKLLTRDVSQQQLPCLHFALQAEAAAEPRNDVIDDDDFEIDEGTAHELPTATADPSQDIPLTEVC